LLSLVISHPVVLFYAQSGAGKTSLLNAKIIPLLERSRALVIGSARVGGVLPKGFASEDIDNIYTFNTLMSLEVRESNPRQLAQKSLSEFLASQSYSVDQDGLFRPQVIIFDQFEEIFTTFPERWRDRECFFERLGAEFDRRPQLRVIFAMREEHIASMDTFSVFLPERLRTRLRLERLRESAALSAVRKPLEGTDRYFAPGAAEKLINNLLQVPIKSAEGTIDVSGEFVEPVQLQVVCKRLWHSLPENVGKIEEQFIADFGDVDKALSSYYEDCLSQVTKTLTIKEGFLRHWFETCLITTDRTRGTVYKDISTTGTLPNEVVSMLEDLRLVRPELRGGAPWYELTHDRFINPILKSNQLWWQTKRQGGKFIELLEARAVDWERRGKPQDVLLTKSETAEISQLTNRESDFNLGLSSALKDFIQASQVVAEQKRAQGLRRQIALLLAALLIAMPLVVYALYARFMAERARTEMENAQLNERGTISETLARQPGKEFDALALGIRAIGPKLDTHGKPPKAAVEGLRIASAALGDKIWLRQVPEKLKSIQLSGNGRFALLTAPNEYRLWDINHTKLLRLGTPGRHQYIASGKVGPDGKIVAIIANDWDQRPLDRLRLLPDDLAGLLPQRIETQVEIYDPTNNKLDSFREPFPHRVEFSEDGRYIAFSSNKLLKIRTAGGLVHTISNIPGPAKKIVFSLDGKLLFWTGINGDFIIFDPENGHEVGRFRLKVKKNVFWTLAISPDGERMAKSEDLDDEAGQKSALIELWSLRPIRKLRKLRIKNLDLSDLSFSPLGDKIATVGEIARDDETSSLKVVIVNVETGALLEVKGVPPFPRSSNFLGARLYASNIAGLAFGPIRWDMTEKRKSEIIFVDLFSGTVRNRVETTSNLMPSFSTVENAIMGYDPERRWVFVDKPAQEQPNKNSVRALLSRACRQIKNQPESLDQSIQSVCSKYL
jgi:hypothetical protein